jgi:hypothetical protein
MNVARDLRFKKGPAPAPARARGPGDEEKEEVAALEDAASASAAEGEGEIDLDDLEGVRFERMEDERKGDPRRDGLASSLEGDEPRPPSLSRKELAARLAELLAQSQELDAALLADYHETFRGGAPARALAASQAAPGPGEDLERQGAGPEPGAFRVAPGRSVERASAAYSSSEDSAASRDDGGRGGQRMGPPPHPTYLAGGSSGAATLLVEANVVSEHDGEPEPAPLLVQATLIRRKRQIAVAALLALAAIATIAGVSAGLTLNRPSLPAATPAPTPAPTSQVDAQFRPTLPPYTLDSLRNASSPQSRAYEWATEVDQVPWTEAPGDDQLALRLARMKQRFAPATLPQRGLSASAL